MAIFGYLAVFTSLVSYLLIVHNSKNCLGYFYGILSFGFWWYVQDQIFWLVTSGLILAINLFQFIRLKRIASSRILANQRYRINYYKLFLR